MEADWEFEIGQDAPVIDACWPGFVDLRWSPQRSNLRTLIETLPETAQFPGLAPVLEKLNSNRSPVWTSKCDFWPTLQAGEFDPDELDAPAGSFTHAIGCYIDLLPRSGQQWSLPETAATDCKKLCSTLHAVPLRCCRIDLVIRRAIIVPDLMDTGITSYFTACGATAGEAAKALESALEAFVHVLCPDSTVQ